MSVPLKHFPKIREARELLLAQAEDLINLKLKIAREALDAGDYETADKSINWLLEHMPAHEGQRVIEASIDNIKQVEGPKGPQISIGIALGGMSNKKELPSAVVIDTIPVTEDNNE